MTCTHTSLHAMMKKTCSSMLTSLAVCLFTSMLTWKFMTFPGILHDPVTGALSSSGVSIFFTLESLVIVSILVYSGLNVISSRFRHIVFGLVGFLAGILLISSPFVGMFALAGFTICTGFYLRMFFYEQVDIFKTWPYIIQGEERGEHT